METNERIIESAEMVVRDPQQSSLARASAADFMPLLTVEQAVQRKGMINQFIGQVLHEGAEAGEGDYGTMPGTKKKVLFKPGAEKLCSIFGLAPQYIEDKIIEDWTGAEHGGEPLFYYSYRCQLTRGGNFMGEAIGSANTWESKYRYRWVGEDEVPPRYDAEDLPQRGGQKTLFEPAFALEKRETTGQYGKSDQYWATFEDGIANGTAKPMRKKLGKREFDGYAITIDQTQYRIPNPDMADCINTVQKIAQKRALVAAVLVVTNASDSFTQDLEDVPQDGGYTPRQTENGGKGQPPAAGATGGAQGPERATPSVPAELVSLFQRIERDPAQFGNAVKGLEEAMVHKFGTVEGLKRYDAVADDFYTRFPQGTRDVAELKKILLALNAEIERPLDAEPVAAANSGT